MPAMSIVDEIMNGLASGATSSEEMPTIVVGFNTGSERRYKIAQDGTVGVKQYNPRAKGNKFWSDWKTVTDQQVADAILLLATIG